MEKKLRPGAPFKQGQLVLYTPHNLLAVVYRARARDVVPGRYADNIVAVNFLFHCPENLNYRTIHSNFDCAVDAEELEILMGGADAV